MADADVDKLTYGHPDNELLSALEPDQLVAASSRPLPRYVLSGAASLALWVLRGFVLIVTAMIIYTFVVSLR